jgi:hypothetical protein
VDDFLLRYQSLPIKQEYRYSKNLKNRLKAIPTTIFIISKEKVDIELVYQLKTIEKITIPGKLFEISDKIEIDALIINNIF